MTQVVIPKRIPRKRIEALAARIAPWHGMTPGAVLASRSRRAPDVLARHDLIRAAWKPGFSMAGLAASLGYHHGTVMYVLGRKKGRKPLALRQGGPDA